MRTGLPEAGFPFAQGLCSASNVSAPVTRSGDFMKTALVFAEARLAHAAGRKCGLTSALTEVQRGSGSLEGRLSMRPRVVRIVMCMSSTRLTHAAARANRVAFVMKDGRVIRKP